MMLISAIQTFIAFLCIVNGNRIVNGKSLSSRTSDKEYLV